MKKLMLFIIPILALSIHFASAQVQLDTVSYSVNDNGILKPYKLIDTANTATILSAQGSYVFDKNSCSFSFYNNTSATGTPVIGSDTYAVLSSLGNSGVWNPVNVINNAACNVSTTENNGKVTLIATKSSIGNGVFVITYTKEKYQPIKLTLSATNNNAAWTNFHIGARDTIEVPRMISLGNATYDLSQYNGTTLDRTWIQNHDSQLIRLTSNSHYDMGLGWNNTSSVTIHWINSKAYLTIDYTYNTPILSPGQTITIDPTIAKDTAAFTYGATPGHTLTSSAFTVGSNANRLLLVTVNNVVTGTPAKTTSVTWNGISMTNVPAANASSSAVNNERTEIWYLVAPDTGNHNVVVTFSSPTAVSAGIGILSLYNASQTTPPVQTGNGTSGNGGTDQIILTPTTKGSWLFGVTARTSAGACAFSDTSDYTDGTGATVCGQHKVTPTIGAKNTLGFGATGTEWATSAVEVLAKTPTKPSIPTGLKANVVSPTESAIDVSWLGSTGATWYNLQYTIGASNGTFVSIKNSSATSLSLSGLTHGTQYVYRVEAGNSSGTNGYSGIRSNYTTNVAPTSLAASNIGTTTARVTWTPPSGNLTGYKIELQPLHAAWSTVTSNTGNTTAHYDLSGLTSGLSYGVRISTNYAFGTNHSGTSSPSSILNFTTNTSTIATTAELVTVVGDAAQINGTTNVTAGYPTPVIVKQIKLYINGSLYNNTAVNFNLTPPYKYNYTFWYQFLNANNQTFSVRVLVTNFTGLSSQTLILSNSTGSSHHREYDPSYFTATTPSLGLVNYTITRNVPGVITLSANRDLGGTTFPMECLYQTASQAMLGITGGGAWVNKSAVGYWYQAQPVSSSQVYYISCFDPGDELFHTSSLVNGSSLLFGISGFDNTFGAFLGVPTGVFFIVMAAALGNRRTAPMWVVIILAIAGMMATIGFFTLDQNVWYLAIIAGLLGLFVGRKLF